MGLPSCDRTTIIMVLYSFRDQYYKSVGYVAFTHWDPMLQSLHGDRLRFTQNSRQHHANIESSPVWDIFYILIIIFSFWYYTVDWLWLLQSYSSLWFLRSAFFPMFAWISIMIILFVVRPNTVPVCCYISLFYFVSGAQYQWTVG